MSTGKGSAKNSVAVQIAGERHVLRSDAPAEYTHAVAAHLDATIRSLGPDTALEPHRAAILAALVITDDLFRTREELRALREEVERRAALLADALERVAADSRGVRPSEPQGR
jgi:cell division protein ZapA